MKTGPRKSAEPALAERTVDDEGFVRRWSRRKADAAFTGTETAPAPATTPVKRLTDEDMPPIESLNADSDFSGFLSPGVSKALRQRALRKLFRFPEFSERSPLDSEYYDCTNLMPLGDSVTHEMREALQRGTERLGRAARRAVLDGRQAVALSGEALKTKTTVKTVPRKNKKAKLRTRAAAKHPHKRTRRSRT